jgi:hypothetical protein
LALHDQLLQPVFRAFGGKVVKTIGDAFLVTFASPTDAVHCGMAVQDRLAEHNARAAIDDVLEVRAPGALVPPAPAVLDALAPDGLRRRSIEASDQGSRD